MTNLGGVCPLTAADYGPKNSSGISCSPAPWTQTFQFDGFGNLTAKILNGTANSIAVDPTTNRLTSALYDANGNMTSGAGATIGYL